MSPNFRLRVSKLSAALGTRLCILLLLFSSLSSVFPNANATAAEEDLTFSFSQQDQSQLNSGAPYFNKMVDKTPLQFEAGGYDSNRTLNLYEAFPEFGLYAYSGSSSKPTTLVMKPQSGYVFDLVSFEYLFPDAFGSYLWVSSGSNSEDKNVVQLDQASAYKLAKVDTLEHPLNGVSQVEFQSDVPIVFQNIVIRNVRPKVPLQFVAQPQDVSTTIGTDAAFSVQVNGAAPFSYRWMRKIPGGVNWVVGTNSSTLTLSNVTDSMNGYQYFVEITDANGVRTDSNAATLTVTPSPTITAQPQGSAVNPGANANFSVTASGTDPLTYQWQQNSGAGFTNLSGKTASTLTLDNVTSSMNGYLYRVVVTDKNDLTVTSNSASLTVTSPPTISAQPQDASVNAGAEASFTVNADGTAPLVYQWQEDTGTGFVNKSGGNQASLTLSNVTTEMDGNRYRVIVTDQHELTVTSEAAVLTVKPLTNAIAPTLTVQPQDQTLYIGDPAELSVSASGSGLLTYQWYSHSLDHNEGGQLIPGATAASFSPSTSSEGNVYYYVVVTNTDAAMTGSKTAEQASRAAKVSVSPQPTYTLTALEDVTLNGLTAGYTTGSQQIQSVVLTRTGTGVLNDLQVALSGPNQNQFTVSQPTLTTLDRVSPTTSFTVKAKDGLAAGTYTAKVTVSAEHMISLSFSVTQTVRAADPPVTPTTPTMPVTPSPPPSTVTEPTTPTPASTAETPIPAVVNGKSESVGTATIAQQNGQSVVTIAVDEAKLAQLLNGEANQTVVTIPVRATSDVVVSELNGQTVKRLEDKQATIRIETNQTVYTLPAQQIDIASLSSQFGENVGLSDIKLAIRIAAPQAEMENVVRQAAKNGKFTLLAPAVDFTVYATAANQTVEVKNFKVYVQRMIAIPADIDPKRIATGVVIEPDGSVRQVPTKIVQEGGRFFAQISSLTNSTYSIIENPLELNDVAQHWSREAVNDMASRLIVKGTADGTFKPDLDVTRAEFAEVVVRALGLKTQNGSSSFGDVNPSAWYSAAAQTSAAYGLIQGFQDGTFRPNEKITREQAMAILSRAMDLTGLGSKLPNSSALDKMNRFVDAKRVSPWAASSVERNLQAGLVSGKNGQSLDPAAYVTRAEIAVMVRNLLIQSGLI